MTSRSISIYQIKELKNVYIYSLQSYLLLESAFCLFCFWFFCCWFFCLFFCCCCFFLFFFFCFVLFCFVSRWVLQYYFSHLEPYISRRCGKNGRTLRKPPDHPQAEHEPRHDKSNKMSVRPAKTQISLGIRPV